MSERSTARGVRVFVSYAHEDEELWNQLSKHLSLLKRRGVISIWHDRKIGVGREWKDEIDAHLNEAHVILLLISADFLASDYCHDVEMTRALGRHDTGEARVIPIILRPVDWIGAPFARLQALPKDAEPITSWPNRDEAFHRVAHGIRRVVEDLIAEQIEPLFEKLARAESLSNWPNVIDLGQRILQLLPDHPGVRSRTAAAYVKRWSGQLKEVSSTGGVIVAPKRHEDVRDVGPRVRADLEHAIALDPGNAEYHYLLGCIGLREDELTRAIELAPATAKYHCARGFARDEDDRAGALRDLERATELGYPARYIDYEIKRLKGRDR